MSNLQELQGALAVRLWGMLQPGLAVVFACCLMITHCPGADAERTPASTFRLMTYNIHHGEGLDQRVDLQRIADLIRQEKADIVAMQEVDRGTQRTQKRDFPAEFAALTGMQCVFSNNYHYQGGEYGNMLLTRFAVKSATNTHFRMLRTGEQRGILQVRLDVDGLELVVMNTHIDFRPDDSERLANIAEIREIIGSYGSTPILLCGDFNDVPSSRTHSAVSELFLDAWALVGSGDGFTIPAAKPTKRIDYVWISKGAPLRPLKAWVPRSNASDHLPLVVEFAGRNPG